MVTLHPIGSSPSLPMPSLSDATWQRQSLWKIRSAQFRYMTGLPYTIWAHAGAIKCPVDHLRAMWLLGTCHLLQHYVRINGWGLGHLSLITTENGSHLLPIMILHQWLLNSACCWVRNWLAMLDICSMFITGRKKEEKLQVCLQMLNIFTKASLNVHLEVIAIHHR